ncbi:MULTISPECIES: ABC transporter permease [Priestia]|jgi:ABC-2 type transport system permease protein|uniref:ABC transporter permease n=1 Tax=Priestia TaxID=2800373 RepID=UPI000BF3DD39|nr:ABC transporter permease [Priestia megaterium]MDN3232870.1 ABC transporter permease [Priestia megaterium]PFJ49560.1 multidrug ABC transporter permease [Priestia megaterium]PFK60615.1 multidrug ABC transporter permease [Priestia megaterium]
MVGTILKKEIKRMGKQKAIYFWTFGLPILFIVVFSSIFGNTNYSFNIHFVDQDHSEASNTFLKSIDKIDSFDTKKEVSVKNAVKQLSDGKIQTLIVIPKGFGDSLSRGNQTSVHFYYDGTQGEAQAVAPVKSLLDNLSNGYREHKIEQIVSMQTKDSQKTKDMLASPLQIQDKKIIAKKVNAVTQIVPGYTVMFVFFIIITMARTFMQDRESGMLSRLFSTPMNRFHYMIGMWIPNVILVLVQITVLLTFGHFVYNLHIGNFGAIALLSVLLSLAGTSLGLLVAFVAKSEQMAIGITQLVTLGGAALGGLWVPLELMPKAIQTTAHFLPQYWAHKAFMDIMARGRDIAHIVPALLYLGIFTLICISLAAVAYKGFVKGATS